MMRWGALVLTALTLAACGNGPITYREMDRIGSDYQHNASSPIAGDRCTANAHRDLIGLDRSAVQASSLPEGARVICHQCAYTEDYQPTRLNVFLGADGKVARLSCG